MSSGLPTTSVTGTAGKPATTTAAPPAPSLDPGAVLSPAELSTASRGPPPLAATTTPRPSAAALNQGIPITQIKFPPSPSQRLARVDAPIFTPAPTQPTMLQPAAPTAASTFGGFTGYGDSYARGSLTYSSPAAPARHKGAYAVVPHVQQPPRFTKLEFTTYDGTIDPLNWLNQCEQFFRGQRTLASDRTWIASYHLRGAAQTWYYSLEQDEGVMPPWERFRDLCLLRFGPPIRGSRLAELGRLPFTSSVQDFADRFQTLACHAPGVTARQRAELFVGGLPNHISVDQSLQGRGARPPPRPAPTPPARPALPTAPAAPVAPTRPFCRLTSAEQLERHRKGLCFNCDEPYASGHVCARLFYLETVNDGDVEAPTAELDDTIAPEPGATTYGPVDATAFVVSLHALAGIKTAKTMLLLVTIHGERLTALVDTGSTHNFLSGDAMHRLALQPSGAEQFSVTVANGDRLTCQGMARQVPISIGDEHFSIDCVGINLGCYDFILGIDFLSTLDPILWDFDALTLIFWREGGRRVQWAGISSTGPATPQLAMMEATLDEAHPLLADLLQQHSDIFDEPHGLPPARPCDHRIHLLPDTAPVAVRPYRYPQLQKDELERQVAVMLAQGIICISTSPFSAPVLLVRKPDDTWRFYIDYRALNALTSKDKFPIPVVNELLDELHGARFFTKLDLRFGYHQVRMHPDDIEKTAFRTHHGHFEFLVMPFGLSNALATF
uniref:Uncharacterized protein n=1 Tax=Avena sativa TaxID=4498 RepID=A0ACD5ULC4_AVESA